MSANAPNLYVSQFTTLVDVLLQQKGSKLRNKVMVQTGLIGKQSSPMDQVGSIEAQTPAGRFAPLLRQDPALARRWFTPKDKEVVLMFDKFDQLRMLSDPKSRYPELSANAIGRAWDDEIIASAFATSVTGETGTGTEAFSSTYSIAADFGSSGTETGLVVPKLIEARRLLRSAEVDIDNEQLTLIIGNQQEADLLNQAQVTSSDFNRNGGVLTDGKVPRFLGFDIVVSNRLSLVSSDNRACIAFAKSGLALGVWEDYNASIDRRTDLSGLPWQLYACSTFGATRTEQGKVIRIYADE